MLKRRVIYILASSIVILSLFGCGQTAGSAESAGSAETATEEAGSSDDVDVDLTSLSSTFVYAEVYNMMTTPSDYMGKKICMEGAFSRYHDDTTGKDYFACIVQDATACCSQGIEFELEGEHKYPDDYPAEGETIRVVGIYDTYMEGESQYCTLRNAHFL